MCKSVINAINFAGGGGSVATGVLQIAGGVALDGTLRAVEDQNGTDSLLQLSTAAVNIGSGTITNNGVLTIKGSGTNIIDFRNSSNVEVGYMNSSGQMIANGFNSIAYFDSFQRVALNNGANFNALAYLKGQSNGVINLLNAAETAFTRLNFGGNGAAQPALAVSGGELHHVYADGTTGFAGFAAGEGTKKGISVIKGASNTPYLGFFGADEIAQPTTAIAEATFSSGGAGTNIKTDDTFGGYTLQQIAQALLDLGFLS